MKKSNMAILILGIMCFVMLCVSIYEIITWKQDSNKTNKQVEEIGDVVKEDNSGEPVQTEEIPEFDPYWDYIKMNLIDVDFNSLKQTNSETVGWIQVNGTNINYPFVQATDNDFYLDHSFDKSKNSAGWVFLDYRNSNNQIDKNSILYAHGRYDKTMFGSLKNSLTSGWLDNINNHVVKLSTENHNTLWQVFSVYRIPNTSDYLQIEFSNNEEFNKFANMLIKRSNYDFKTSVTGNDKILTLSTCWNDDEKVVLHAKLIKIKNR